MAVGLTAVAATTRSILLRDIDQRVTRLHAQEAGEFVNLVERGQDPETGRPFNDADRLLRVFLERQYADPDEELLGVVDGRVIRQTRDIPSALPLHEDRASLREITSSTASSGTLHRPQGEIRWSKVVIEPGGKGAPRGTFVVAFHADREQEGVEEIFRILLAISGVALLMTVCVGWAAAGRILAPVRLVRTTAAQLTEQDLTRRIPVEGKDDIAALAETFNGMLDRLERAFAVQRQFVDDAGHELRTPITIVRGHLEVMGTATETAAEREETIRLVTDELDRMSRIVEDLLLLAKSERPDFVSPEPVELAELTADVFVKARTLGDRDWRLAEVAEGTVLLDPQRVTQAMVQLAQNAVQHTAPGATVWIGSRRTAAPGPQAGTGPAGAPLPPGGSTLVPPPGPAAGGWHPGTVELYVADTGPGVRADDAELIFERFRRGTSRRGSGSGAGLGLSIVKAIADGHPGGGVELRATPGGGATFVIAVPAAPGEDG
ncbi:ATP-binding protein [Streptomyces sp. HNM0574]|uniref:sensor histidine kinase n=1 Tax=Streptomyces sp. HNM0574 TaxID=2714954 RepID=UPI001F112F32|nr:ATP-binding protein [Streptomyces sp. HNM0574]